MEHFVSEHSVVRKIWGKADTILFIFAGAAAEFALNKAVDWLYFTGRLPADPIGRLFSTVSYAKQIIFAEKGKAHAAIAGMKHIHTHVETARGAAIPDWAYRDVLFMLIHYSIAAFELLERKLTTEEKLEVLQVFCEVGRRMKISPLPAHYEQWTAMRNVDLNKNLESSKYSVDLYKQYRKHLGNMRYLVLLQVQSAIAPEQVRVLLKLKTYMVFKPAIMAYKVCRSLKIERFLKSILLPKLYKQQISQLDYHTEYVHTPHQHI